MTLSPSSHGSLSPQLSPASTTSSHWAQQPAAHFSQSQGFGVQQVGGSQVFGQVRQQQQLMHGRHQSPTDLSLDLGLDESVQEIGPDLVRQSRYER